MSKKILLAAAALSAIAVAGGANAASVGYRAGGAAIVTTSTPYTLARELNYSAGVQSAAGAFDTVVRANSALGAGTYTISVNYAGATFGAAVSTAAVTDAATCATGQAAGIEASTGGLANGASSLTLTSGGAAGGNNLTYTLQVPQGADVEAVCFAPALSVNGPVSATVTITNQVTGQPVDPSVIQPLITTTTQGFAAATMADTVTTAILAGTASPYFRTLSADTTIGTISYAAATTAATVNPATGAAFGTIAYKDLIGTPVQAADVVSGAFTVTGDLTGLNVTAGGTVQAKAGNTATVSLTGSPITSPTVIALAPVGGANAPQINPSAYSVSGSFSLAPAFSGPLTLSSTALETVGTEGLTYVIPWVSSRTQGAATGSRTVVRISRVGSNVVTGGNVYAQVLNPIRGSAVGNWALVGTLGASGEVVMSSDTFENVFGDFGRGDIRLALTPNNGAGFDSNYAPLQANNIIVKRVITQPNGGVSEMDVVAVGDNGTPNDVQTNFAAPAAPAAPPVIP